MAEAPSIVTVAAVVHFIHGTFPRGMICQLWWNLRAPVVWWRRRRGTLDPRSIYPQPHRAEERRFWFEEGSGFEQAIRQLLGPDADQVAFTRFLWSGNNSFTARARAARELREHLTRSRREEPGARHLLVAHSHGGTAAAMAIDLAKTSVPLAEGMLALATPFVWLAPRFTAAKPSPGRALIASCLPRLLLLLVPLLAVAMLLRSAGGLTLVAGWLGLGLGLVALGLRQAVLSAFLLVAMLLASGPATSSDAITLSIPLVFAAGFLAVWERSPFAISGIFELVQTRPLRLPCPLSAIRAPNDEASLVIGVAQFVERLFQLTTGLLGKVVALLARPLDWPPGGTRWHAAMRHTVLIVYLVVLGLVALGVYDLFWGPPSRHWVERLVVAGPALGILLSPLAILWLLAWLVPAAIASLATGNEAFSLPALYGVDAEALPYAEPEDSMRLIVDGDAARALEGSALVHSLHDLPEIRTRVADWIRAFLP